MWMIWLINLAASQDSERISQSNEKPYREHQIPGWPAWQTQESAELRQTVADIKWISEDSGRSDRFHLGVAWKMVTYIWIHVRWIYSNSSVLVKYIIVTAQKDRAIELQDKLDNFKDRFIIELMIDMWVEQGLVSGPNSDCPTCLICGISVTKSDY